MERPSVLRNTQRHATSYLFAIEHGARFVWDFDDDNELLACGPPLHQSGLSSSARGGMVSARLLAPDESPTFNPYPMMGAPHSPVWPRGLPLERVRVGGGAVERPVKDETIPVSSVGCYQVRAHARERRARATARAHKRARGMISAFRYRR